MPRQRSPDKRQRIVHAAIKVFARKGYFRARVSEIAREADVADGTIYLYFQGKEDILVALFDDVMSEHIEAARADLSQLSGVSEKLSLIARRHLELLGSNRDLAVVFQVELRRSTHFMERFTASWLRDYFDIVDGVIAAGQKHGSLRADLPRKVVAKAFFGALDEMVTSWILSKKTYALAPLAAPVVDLVLRGAALESSAKAATPRPRLAAGAR